MSETPARYEYYLLGDTMPVRVGHAANGLRMSAEVPDPEIKGLRHDVAYLSRLEQSAEVEEINEDDFLHFCERIYSWDHLPRSGNKIHFPTGPRPKA